VSRLGCSCSVLIDVTLGVRLVEPMVQVLDTACGVSLLPQGSRWRSRSWTGWRKQSSFWRALLPGELAELRLQFVLEVVDGGGARSCGSVSPDATYGGGDLRPPFFCSRSGILWILRYAFWMALLNVGLRMSYNGESVSVA
jgi:hypothetical protein